MKYFDGKAIAFGWIIGYFIFTYPIRMWLPHSFVYSLFHSCLGLAIAVILMWVGGQDE